MWPRAWYLHLPHLVVDDGATSPAQGLPENSRAAAQRIEMMLVARLFVPPPGIRILIETRENERSPAQSGWGLRRNW